jgi:hypothetical protein
MVGRIKPHLNHIKWAVVEKAAERNKPIRVKLALTNAKGNPVMASLRPDVAKWELTPWVRAGAEAAARRGCARDGQSWPWRAISCGRARNIYKSLIYKHILNLGAAGCGP